MDKIVSLLQIYGVVPRLTYNRNHVALGTTGYNFCWFHPRKSARHCHIEFRVTREARASILSSLQSEAIDAAPRRTENITFSITVKGLEEHSVIVRDVLGRAEKASRV